VSSKLTLFRFNTWLAGRLNEVKTFCPPTPTHWVRTPFEPRFVR
jgi:hypothetical protein